MSAVTSYRFELDRTSKKFSCPQCGTKRFVRCVDTELKEYLPDHVGRCDRENGCGYEYSWSQYLKELQSGQKPLVKVLPIEEEKALDFIPVELALPTIDLRHYQRNNLFLFLASRFGEDVALSLRERYLFGTSAYWKGATVYWQIDIEGNLRQCKILLVDHVTGKRKKEGAIIERLDQKTKSYVLEATTRPCSMVYGKFLNNETRQLNLEQCFYGEHLLAEYPYLPVCIVESEKTALIASVYLPEFVWLATGGASGCRWRDYRVYKVLQGRTVTFYPDYGLFNKKTGRTCFEEWTERCARIAEVLPGTKIRVSNLLEKKLRLLERNDQDLADLFLSEIVQLPPR